MKYVEHSYLDVPLWAERIRVERVDDGLLIRGEGPGYWLESATGRRDRGGLLARFTEFGRQKRTTRGEGLPPHHEFAGATDDDQLESFVRRFGPVASGAVAGVPAAQPTAGVEALERWPRLRAERRVFAAAVQLVAELQHGEKAEARTLRAALDEMLQAALGGGRVPDPHWHGHTITAMLAGLARREAVNPARVHKARTSQVGRLSDTALRRFARDVIGALLNQFPPMLVVKGDRFVDLPVLGPSGILPALYFMLRRDLLIGQGIGICARPECAGFFPITRHGARYCSPECSRLHRQRDYFRRKGKKRRRERLRQRKSTKRVGERK